MDAGMAVASTIEAIETEVDDWCVGPPKAFFTLPSGRVMYKTYRYMADDPQEALDAVRHLILNDAREDGEGSYCSPLDSRPERATSVMLFWRSRNKVQVTVDAMSGRYFARARCALVKSKI